MQFYENVLWFCARLRMTSVRFLEKDRLVVTTATIAGLMLQELRVTCETLVAFCGAASPSSAFSQAERAHCSIYLRLISA